MKIVHVVSSISSINYGIWNAAIFGSLYLKKEYDIDSELWICTKTVNDTIEPQIPFTYFSRSQLSGSGLGRWFLQFDKEKTIFVTHGTWLRPTHIGYRAKKSGYRWVYLSQGMLEPWALKNDWLKKKIYFILFERRMASRADRIRAVSLPEKENLEKLFRKKINLIHNGVDIKHSSIHDKTSGSINFLFLARLHHKKGIVPLVKAWHETMKDAKNINLTVVGPDEGELSKIRNYLDGNIKYIGPVFGEEKKKLLKAAHYYILPTFSEGFPSSVVEAMSFGDIPVISAGANFPEVFNEKLGYEIDTDSFSIGKVLKNIACVPFDNNLSFRNFEYVRDNLSEKIISEKLYLLYKELIVS